VDEFSITGEPEHKKKNSISLFIFGMYHLEGFWKNARNHRWHEFLLGKTIALIIDKQEQTPLQEKLEDLVTLIGKIGLAVAVLVRAS